LIEEIELSILQNGGLTQCAPSPKGDAGGMAPPRMAGGKAANVGALPTHGRRRWGNTRAVAEGTKIYFCSSIRVLRAFIYQSQIMDLLNAITGPNINPQVACHPTKFIQADELRSDHGIPHIRIVD